MWQNQHEEGAIVVNLFQFAEKNEVLV